MKKFLLFLFTFNYFFAQVGIGTTDPKAALDINVSNSGVLLPRIALTTLTDIDPIDRAYWVDATVASLGLKEEGTFIFNTTTDPGENLEPGFYFWLGGTTNSWVPFNYTENGWAFTGNEFLVDKELAAGGGIKSNDPYFEDYTFVGSDFTTQNVNSSGYFSTLIDSNNSPTVTDDDPSWVFSDNAYAKRFLGTSDGDTSPYFLANNGIPAFMLYDGQFLAMRRGQNSKPAYTFYDSPGTGFGATTNWKNPAEGKGRELNQDASDNFSRSTLVLSVDGEAVMELQRYTHDDSTTPATRSQNKEVKVYGDLTQQGNITFDVNNKSLKFSSPYNVGIRPPAIGEVYRVGNDLFYCSGPGCVGDGTGTDEEQLN